MAQAMRFIRKNGHVIPIRASSGATATSKKKYPKVKDAGPGAAAIGAAIGVVSGKSLGFGIVGTAALAGITAYNFGTTKLSRAAKGESNQHLANRISNLSNSSKKRK